VSQTGDANYSYFDQGGPPPPEANKEGDSNTTGSVTQLGSANTSNLRQRADNAFATVDQNGTGNVSTVFQGAGTNNQFDENGDRAIATVSQTGDDNRSVLNQGNDDVTASVTQNTAGLVSGGLPSNDSLVTQNARFGSVTVEQTGV